jgi:predicted aldo/keto reductase-like oxidoreductase
LFSSYNTKQMFDDWNVRHYYQRTVADNGKASDCIRCGKCERVCPQHLPIRDLLKQVAEVFEQQQ